MLLSLHSVLKDVQEHQTGTSPPLPAVGESVTIQQACTIGRQLVESGRYSNLLGWISDPLRLLRDGNEEKRSELAMIFSTALYLSRRFDELGAFVSGSRNLINSETAQRLQVRLAISEAITGNTGKSHRRIDSVTSTEDDSASQGITADLAYYRAACWYREPGIAQEVDRWAEFSACLYRLLGEHLYLCGALITRSLIQWSLGHSQYAVTLGLEAFTNAMKVGNNHLAVRSLRQVAVYLYNQGEYEKSADCLDVVTNLSSDIPSVTLSEAAPNQLARAKLALLREDYSDARYHLDASKELVRAERPAVRFLLDEFEGVLRMATGNATGAISFFDSAIATLNNDRIMSYELAGLFWRRGAAQLEQHSPVAALDDSNEAIRLIESYGDYREYGHALRVKGAALAMLARIDDAKPILRTAISVLRARNDQRELAIGLMTLAELHEEDPRVASNLATEASTILNRLQLPNLLSDAQHIADVARLRNHAQERHSQNVRSDRGNGQMVVEAEAMRLLLADCRLIAQSHAAVVITGETGTGKEVVARYIHEHSMRCDGPFFAINCAAMPESLFEREFFGHAKGAFTGADRNSKGFVDAANGGTLFLDEIGELPLPMQAKLLRLLQEHTYRRVGDVNELRADIRILAATNRNLKEQVEEKTFREDLWYRLKAFEVRIPPLRERTEDIAALTDLFLERESERVGIEFWMDREVRQLFERYPWPGNVRELEAAVAAGTARAIEDGCIRVEHLPHELRGSKGTRPTAILSLTKHLEIEERRLILHALRHCNNSRAEAARYLGIGRNTLYEKMQRLGIALGKEARG